MNILIFNKNTLVHTVTFIENLGLYEILKDYLPLPIGSYILLPKKVHGYKWLEVYEHYLPSDLYQDIRPIKIGQVPKELQARALLIN